MARGLHPHLWGASPLFLLEMNIYRSSPPLVSIRLHRSSPPFVSTVRLHRSSQPFVSTVRLYLLETNIHLLETNIHMLETNILLLVTNTQLCVETNIHLLETNTHLCVETNIHQLETNIYLVINHNDKKLNFFKFQKIDQREGLSADTNVASVYWISIPKLVNCLVKVLWILPTLVIVFHCSYWDISDKCPTDKDAHQQWDYHYGYGKLPHKLTELVQYFYRYHDGIIAVAMVNYHQGDDELDH